MNTRYDIIGDIHGHADALRGLLAQLGYRERDGVFQHPARTAIFVGDFIDRGPRIRETLHIIRAMVDSGAALAVMGNHEYNAICLHTPDVRGGWLMERTANKMSYHRATLDDFYGVEGEWREWLAWFKTLPLAIDLGTLRVVHAVWDDELIAALPVDRRLTDEWLHASRVRRSHEHNAIEVLLKGRELPLPKPHAFTDKEGMVRHDIRLRWWLEPTGLSYANASLPYSPTVPDEPIPATLLEGWRPYPTDAPPVFIGHYWMSGAPELLAPNVACLDYSVAKAGSLIAYRWDGERELHTGKFVVGPRGAAR